MTSITDSETKKLRNDEGAVIIIKKHPTFYGHNYFTIKTIIKHCTCSFYCDSSDTFGYKLVSDVFEGKKTWKLGKATGSCGLKRVNLVIPYEVSDGIVSEHKMELRLQNSNDALDLAMSLEIRTFGDITYLDMYNDGGNMYSTVIDNDIKLVESLVNKIKNDTYKDFTITHDYSGYGSLNDSFTMVINYTVEGGYKKSMVFKLIRKSIGCVIS